MNIAVMTFFNTSLIFTENVQLRTEGNCLNEIGKVTAFLL